MNARSRQLIGYTRKDNFFMPPFHERGSHMAFFWLVDGAIVGRDGRKLVGKNFDILRASSSKADSSVAGGEDLSAGEDATCEVLVVILGC